MRLFVAVIVLHIVISRAFELKNFTFGDHDYQSLQNILHESNKKCPEISQIYTLTEKSVEGRDLIVIEFTADRPGTHIAGVFSFLLSHGHYVYVHVYIYNFYTCSPEDGCF